MSKYAIIQLAGKQYKVAEGTVIEVDRQEDLTSKVLLYSNGDNVTIGTPDLVDVTVHLETLGDKNGGKVSVNRFRSKSRYRKRMGHKQPLTVVKVAGITLKGEKPDSSKAQEPKQKASVKRVSSKTKKAADAKTTKQATKPPEKKVTKKGSSKKADK